MIDTPQQGKNAANENLKNREEKDPTYGKPLEFFKMFPLNRKISPHLFNNPLQPSTGQLDFIAKYYPDKKDSPNEVMMELYSYS